MRKIFRCLAVAVALAGFSQPAMAQFDLGGALRGAAKTYQALTLSDEQVADYARESIAYMDSQNEVCGPKDPYTIRLSKLTAGLTQADGVPLNFKVYKTTDVNAFACPDGSVRVFSGMRTMRSHWSRGIRTALCAMCFLQATALSPHCRPASSALSESP